MLVATPYVLEEVARNRPDLPEHARVFWTALRPELLVMDDVLTLDWPSVFTAGKDRPVLFSALAWAEVLLTLDRGDFGSLRGGEFYGLSVLKPGMFLELEHAASRLKT